MAIAATSAFNDASTLSGIGSFFLLKIVVIEAKLE